MARLMLLLALSRASKTTPALSAAILSELKTFRLENNEKLTAMTSAMSSIERPTEKQGECLTVAGNTIDHVSEGGGGAPVTLVC